MLLICAFFITTVSVNITTFAQTGSDTAMIFTPEEQEFVKSHKNLKVGFVTDRIPVSFADKNGEFAGISRHILDRISEISGFEFEYAELPTKNVTYDYLIGNGFDLVTSVEFNEENKKARGILISEPYFSSRKVIVAHQNFEFKYDSHFKVAVSTGSQTLKKVLAKAYPNFVLEDYDSISDCLDALENGKSDLMIQNQYVVEYWLAKPKYESLKVIPVVGLDDRHCFSAVMPFGEGSEAKQQECERIIHILDKAIASLSEDEIGNFTIQGVMENQYNYNFDDFFSRYKYAVIIFCVSFSVIVLLAILLIRQRIHAAESRADAKAKGQFLSTMSHEIRTPLNGLIGLNHLMSQSTDNSKLEEYLKQSTVTAKYLLSLVNDILDSSKLEAKRLELENSPVDIKLLTETVGTSVSSAMNEKGLHFTVNTKIKAPYFLGDPVRIQQILLNLLDNARKFTSKGGGVTLALRQEIRGEKVHNVFTVADTGKGMSEEFRGKIFEAFSQELETVSKGNQGTGLGLSISRRLARLMGGELSCVSEKGMGSTFTFTFDAKVCGAPDDNFAKAGNEDIPHPKVLVAEDNELNAEIVVELLKNNGFEAEVAENGKLALEIFKNSAEGEFGVILMDLLMPELDGFETAKAVRALDRSDAKTVKIIACTANSFNNEQKRSLDCGMNDFMTKPMDVDELLEKLLKP